MLTKAITAFILSIGVTYLLAVLAMFILQRHFMYFPSHKNPHPSEVRLSGVSVENLETNDGEKIVVWYAPAEDNKPTVLFLHGNGGEMSDRTRRLSAYREEGLGVLFVSWRGYGGSSGSPTEDGIITDTRTAYDWLTSRGVNPGMIAVIGESLGTGAAVRLAAEQPIGALILGAPYTAAVDIASARFPWLPVKLLMKDQFRSIDHIGSVKAPTLVLHGPLDGIIPYSSGKKLYEAVSAPKQFISFENEGHGLLFRSTTFAKEINFMREVFQY